MRLASFVVRSFAVASLLLTACQPADQGMEPSDGGGMDGSVEMRSTSQGLETSSLCGNMSGLQPNAPWPMSGGCPGRNAHASEVGPTSAVKRWSFDTFSDVRSSVAIASDGSIIFGADNGIAYRVDPTSGAIRNQLTLGGAIKATPALSADTAYLPSESGKLFAIALSDFKLKPGFPFPTGAAITSSPLILPNGNIVVGSNDTNVRAISPLGTTAPTPTVWIRKTGGAVSGSAAMSANGDTIFIGSQDKFAYGLDSSNGVIRWQRQLAAAITSSPAVTKFNLVIFTAATTVYALDATTGVIVWQKALGSSGTAASPAITREGVILVGAAFGPFAGGSLQAFRPSDGTLLFRHDTLGGIETTPAIDNQGNAFFGTNNGTLHAVNAAGRAIFTHTLPNGVAAGIKSSPVLSAQGLTFGCDDNFIYNFSGARALSPAGAACTADAECAPTLLCGADNGPRFGKPAGGACAPLACFNKAQDPGETEVDCGGTCGTCANICSQSCTAGSQIIPPALEVLSFTKGAFSRGSEGTYQTSANKVAVARGDQLRYEDRGDGNGRVALFEGARTNRIVWSEAMGHLPEWWTGVAQTPTMTLTEDTTVSPNGAQTADRWQAQAGGNAARAQTIINAMPVGSLSAWLRLTNPASFNPASPLKTRTVLTDLTGGWYNEVLDWSLPAVWERRSMVTTPATKSTAVQMSHKGAWPGSATQFPALPAADFVVWGWQLEEGKFPSSYIPTQESAVTRKVDQVLFETTVVPTWLRTGKWQIDVLPLYSSAEIATTDEFVLMAWEGGQLSLAKDQTGGLIKLVSGTTTAKRTIAWARNTKLTVTFDATAKTLQVIGATTGDGSQSYGSIAVATGRVSLGALFDGAKPAFARVSEPRKVASATVACVPDTDCVFCGDGTVTPPEACDPGRNARCNDTCTAETGLTQGDPNGNCPPGQVRGIDNGAFFGVERELDLCWPAICPLGQAQQCGSATSVCGYCLCLPNCAGKSCGGNLDNGCGGTCEVTCNPGQCGCTADSQCGSGNRCLIGQGARFGCAPTANVCAPEVCDDFYKDASQCGTPGAPCGNPCPQSAASCTALLCGQDADGLACPNTCTTNEACVGGLCINPNVFVDPTLPPDLPALPKAQTPDIGAIPARFEVTPRGTASYAMSIEAPAGYNGMQPKLELRYDSSGGNGYLGQGWTLSGLGLSMIQRCAKTFADDGENSAPKISSDDALCLEGQRLIRVGGDASTIEFRTVPDSFSKIQGHITAVAAAGPTSFTVRSKDGLVYTYGKEEPGCIINSTTANREKGCNNSRVFQEAIPTQAFKVRAWALSSVRDRAGNELRVFYSSPGQCNSDPACATEEMRPERIAYSGGGYLNFVYKSRTDRISAFRNGAPVRKTRLLAKVVSGSTYGNYRSYWFGYATTHADGTAVGTTESARLAQVQMCAGDSTVAGNLACLTPTRFEHSLGAGQSYKTGFEADKLKTGMFIPLGTIPNLPPTYKVLPAMLDADGDGRTDILFADREGLGHTLLSGFSRSGGNSSFRVRTPLIESDPSSKIGRMHEVVDIDRRGQAEILVSKPDRNNPSRTVWQVMSYGANRFSDTPGFPDLSTENTDPLLLDVNGDGLTDVLDCRSWKAWFQGDNLTFLPPISVARTDVPGAENNSLLCGRSSVDDSYFDHFGTGRSRLEDMDGDQIPDLLTKLYFPAAKRLRSYRVEFKKVGSNWRATGVEISTPPLFDVMTGPWGDFNGDGYREPLGTMNTGLSLIRATGIPSDSQGFNGRGNFVVDYDGDGRDDLIDEDNMLYGAFADGKFKISEPIVFQEYFEQLRTGDLDGDGAPDLMIWNPDNPAVEVRLQLGVRRPQRVSAILDGLGNRISVAYGATQLPGSANVGGSFDPASAFRGDSLVSSVGYSGALQRNLVYSYGALQRDIQRNQTLGFDRIVVQDRLTWTDTRYDRSYANGSASVATPGHGGRHIAPAKPKSRRVVRIVAGSILTNVAQEVWETDETWRWEKRTSSAGILFAHPQTYTRTTVAGVPNRSIGQLSTIDSIIPAASTSELDLTRMQDVDSYGNVVSSETQWSDGRVMSKRSRFINTPESLAAWQVSLKDREVTGWFAGSNWDRGEAPVPGRLDWTSTDFQRYSFEYDARFLPAALTREPSVVPWDNPSGSALVNALMQRAYLTHELRTEVVFDTRARLTDQRQIGGTELRATRLTYAPFDGAVYPNHSYDELGHDTVLHFNRNSGQLQTLRTVDGIAVSNQYDQFDRLSSSTGPDGKTTITMQRAGAPVQLPVTGEEAIEVRGHYTRVVAAPNGEVEGGTYDSLNRPIVNVWKNATGLLVSEELAYAPDKNVLVRRTRSHLGNTPSTASSRYTYDDLDRLVDEVEPGTTAIPRTTSHYYAHPSLLVAQYRPWIIEGPQGTKLVTAERNPRGNVYAELSGVRGEPLLTVDPDGVKTAFLYGPFDHLNITGVIDTLGSAVVTENEFTAHGWLRATKDPDMGTHTFTHTKFGEVKTHIDGNSKPSSYTYDTMGRAVQRDDGDGTFRWEWDCRKAANGSCLTAPREAIGKPVWSRTPEGHETEYLYEPTFGNVTQETHRIKDGATTNSLVFNYGYDGFGQLQGMQYPTTETGQKLVVSHNYIAGQLAAVTDITTGTASVIWARGLETYGRRDSELFGNNVVSTREFDPKTGEVIRIESFKDAKGLAVDALNAGSYASKRLSSLALAYDPNGNLLTRSDLENPGTIRSWYDKQDRMTDETLEGVGGNSTIVGTYRYDDLGNLASKKVGTEDVGTYTYEPTRRHVLAQAGGLTFQHDLNGNQVRREGARFPGGVQTIAFNARDLVKSVTNGAGTTPTVSYEYNAQDERVLTRRASGVTLHTGKLYERADENGVRTHRYRVEAEGKVVAELERTGSTVNSRFVHSDWRGSPTLLTGAAGAVLGKPRFDAFGAALPGNSGGTKIGFTAHRPADESGLVDMGGRFYDPWIARFVSADPFVQNPAWSQSYNRYAYVFGNPLSLTDPTGFQADDVCTDKGCTMDDEVVVARADKTADGKPAERTTVSMDVPRPNSDAREQGPAGRSTVAPERQGVESPSSPIGGPSSPGPNELSRRILKHPFSQIGESLDLIVDYLRDLIDGEEVQQRRVVCCSPFTNGPEQSDGSGIDGKPQINQSSGSGKGQPKSGETAATAAGRAAHKAWKPPPGFQKEFKLPSGRQADAVNPTTREVIELKPNNRRAIREGKKQVERYVKELEETTGLKWTGRVETY